MDFLIALALGILGAALVAGGFVAYRRSAKTGAKAVGAAAMAGGTVILAIIVLATPVSQSTGG